MMVFAAPALADPPATGSISGQATSGVTGKPLAGITVNISRVGGQWTTDASGNYTASGLPAAGGYQVSFMGGCCYDQQYYNGQSSASTATGVTVTANQTTTGISAAMQIDPKWTITGTVTDASTGAPLPGAQVYEVAASGAAGGYEATPADANGTYGIAASPGTYTVGFSEPFADSFSPVYANQFYNDKPTASGANPVTVTSGQLTPGIDAALLPAGSVSGTVTDAATGAPAAGIQVLATGQAGISPLANKTDSSGHYRFSVAQSGPYEIAFKDPTGKLAGQYYGGGVQASTATPASVSPGQTTTANIALGLAGHISGAVTLPKLSLTYFVNVQLPGPVGPFGRPFDQFATFEGGGASGAAYSVGGLLPGVPYTLKFFTFKGNTPQGNPLYYCEATTAAAATTLTVTAGKDLSDINEVFPNTGAAPPACAQPKPTPTSTPTAAHIGSALASRLAVRGKAARIAAILKARGYPEAVTALEAGTLKIAWYDVPAGAHLARVVKPILVADGSHRFSAAGTAKIKLRLTGKGRALLKKAKHIKLTAVGTFAAKHGKAITRRRSITLSKT